MNPLTRIAFRLKLQSAGGIEAYIDRHRPIWPELTAVFVEHGVVNYSIFLNRESLELFGYAEVRSPEQWAAIARTATCRKWWAHMADLMVCNQDGTPWSEALEEVFHHEISGGRSGHA